MNNFYFRNLPFDYIINVLNTNGDKTERIVELPLIAYFLNLFKYSSEIIEIGCVSPYYFDTKHSSYDITDNHKSCIKINAKNLNFKNKYVLSISTIEHFNVDNYNIPKSEFLDPYDFLLELVSVSKKYLITFPLGYNSELDKKILMNNIINTKFLSRVNKSSIWTEKTKSELTESDKIYDFSYKYCANTITVIENIL